MPNLSVLSIGRERLAQAYPLIRSAARVTPERWQEFGEELIAHGGGVLIATAEDGCVHGVAAFRPSGNLRHLRSLEVDIIVAFELRCGARVRDSLRAALDEIAINQGCRSVNLTMAAKAYGDPASPARTGLEQLGLTLETVSFVKELPPSARPAQSRK